VVEARLQLSLVLTHQQRTRKARRRVGR